MQIVGTSEGFTKSKNKKNMKKKALAMAASDSEESYSTTSHGSARSNVTQSFSPSTPPPIQNVTQNYRSAKRRKGIPHRAPFGSLIWEY